MSVYGTYDWATRINNQRLYMPPNYTSNYTPSYTSNYTPTFTGAQYSQQMATDEFVFDVSEATGNTCTDGIDDGKIGFGEGLACFAKGLVKPFTEALKHPLKTALIIGGCAALTFITGGAATPFLIAGGLGVGAFQVGKGLYGFATAETDAQKKDSLENLGTGTTTLVGSVAGAKAYAKNVTGQSQSVIDSLKIVKDGLKFHKTTPPPVSSTTSTQQNTSQNSASAANGAKPSSPQLEAPKSSSSSTASSGTSSPNGATPPNSGVNPSSSAQVKWDVDTIRAAFQNAKANGSDAAQLKSLYRAILKEIHPDSIHLEYEDAGLLMTALQDCYHAVA